MRVIIITEAGRTVGLGHLTRCSSLYEAFKEKGVVPHLVINADDTVEEIFFENKKTERFNWLKERPRLFGLVKETDIAIIDSYLADLKLYEAVSQRTRLLVSMDDYRRLDYPRGVVINAALSASELDYPKKDGIRYLLGTGYVALRREFWEVPRKRIKTSVKRTLLTFGRYDTTNTIPYVSNILTCNYPALGKSALIGKGAEGLKEMIERCDMAISAGGQTLCELVRVGVPTIAVATAENQLNNIMGLERAGAVKYAGRWGTGDDIGGNIIKALEDMKGRGAREDLSSRARSVIDGKGPLRIVDFLMKTLSGANIEFADILGLDDNLKNKIRIWRNTDGVRKSMLTQHTIGREEHSRWIEGLKNSDNQKVWVVFVDKTPIGAVNLQRIKRDELSSEWGIYIAEEGYRNRGYGKRALLKLLEIFFDEMGFRTLITRTISTNAAALNIYNKFGFNETRRISRPDGTDEIDLKFSAGDWLAGKAKIKNACENKNTK